MLFAGLVTPLLGDFIEAGRAMAGGQPLLALANHMRRFAFGR
jgi:hypothetical protein